MIIGINDAHEVVLIADGIEIESTEDMTVYCVDAVPKEEAGKRLCFDPESESFYFREYTAEEKEAMKEARELFRKREEARASKEKALAWLSENDWKVNKHILGEWSDEDERWQEYKTTRAQMRAAIDEADAILNT